LCTFFPQADTLAYGRILKELRAEGFPDYMIPHKVKFTSNHPALSMLLPTLKPYTVGQLPALYEHWVLVQRFIWGINSLN
ncbi:hypothetical protein SELMODRAFT_17747, partial [Selaginella moellendorffii]